MLEKDSILDRTPDVILDGILDGILDCLWEGI